MQFKKVYYTATVIKTVWYCWRDICINQWIRRETSEKDPKNMPNWLAYKCFHFRIYLIYIKVANIVETVPITSTSIFHIITAHLSHLMNQNWYSVIKWNRHFTQTSSVFPQYHFSVPRSYTGYHITSSYHVSLGSSLFWQFLGLIMFLVSLIVSRNISQAYCRML